MDDALILETTFLIDLERETSAGAPGPATRFLEQRPEERLCTTVTTAGELAAGATAEERRSWDELLDRLRVLPIDREVCWRYGHLYQYLKRNGLLIGTNDLWIAATAVEHRLPLVSRNVRHFRRVPDLQVVAYAEN